MHNVVKESRPVCTLLGVHVDKELRMRRNDHAQEVAIEGIKKLSWPGEDWNDLKMHTATELFRPKPSTANRACQPWS